MHDRQHRADGIRHESDPVRLETIHRDAFEADPGDTLTVPDAAEASR